MVSVSGVVLVFTLCGASGLTTTSPDVSSGDRPSQVSFDGRVSLLVRGFNEPYFGGVGASLSEAERKNGKKEHLRKRAHSSTEGDSLVKPNPSSEGFSELPPLYGIL
ncbi:hypothetical protein ACLOJK_039815 [Asimina triloba]